MVNVGTPVNWGGQRRSSDASGEARLRTGKNPMKKRWFTATDAADLRRRCDGGWPVVAFCWWLMSVFFCFFFYIIMIRGFEAPQINRVFSVLGPEKIVELKGLNLVGLLGTF